MKADLHIHTNISDGTDSLEQVIKTARDKGLEMIAITNHDTVKGLGEAVVQGKQAGIRVVPGVEISAYDYVGGKKVHLLGYGISLEGPHIQALCEPMLQRRNQVSLEQIQILLRHGYELDLLRIRELADQAGVIYKQHIMMALIEKGYTDGIYSPLYYELFKNNGICQIDIDYVDVFDALKAIQADGGSGVLAHPGPYRSYDLVASLAEAGLAGIEVYHRDHTPQDHQLIFEMQRRYGFKLLTGGTDYHGWFDEGVEIGQVLAPPQSSGILLENF